MGVFFFLGWGFLGCSAFFFPCGWGISPLFFVFVFLLGQRKDGVAVDISHFFIYHFRRLDLYKIHERELEFYMSIPISFFNSHASPAIRF